MTREEADRIDQLVCRVDDMWKTLSTWRDELSTSRASAIQEHADNCSIKSEVREMHGSLMQLVKIQTKRDAIWEMKAKNRAKLRSVLKDVSITIGIFATMVGAAIGVISAL